ncbi:GntR family transcriptional regulator [Ralstonia nicotianae]|nr:GntR family transcriptional regulator [Ralstonia solanacearum]
MTPRLPKYLELADRIRLDILHGALPAGSVAPSENEVAQCYGVSRLTARRTLNELAQRGLLKRSRGQRSVVLDRVGPHRPVLYAPGQSDAVLEYVPGAVYSVSAFRQETADATVAAALDLQVGAPVAHVERRARVDGAPIMLLRTWLTSRLAAMLEARDFEDRLFVQVFQRANLAIARSREAPLACVADAYQARELDVAQGVPLVRVRRIGYSVADVPISLTYCDFSPERYTREVDIRVLQTD